MTIRHQPYERPQYETRAIARLAAAAHARGWTIDVEPATRFAARITLPDGRRHFLIGADLGLNSSAARRVAEDKAFAAHFLALDGLPVVPTFPVEDAASAARTITEHGLAFPVVIKPNRAHEARGLTVARTEHELAAAVDAARAIDPIVLLQPFDPRAEHRLILLGGDLIAAFGKHRPRAHAPANLAAGAAWTDVTPSVHREHLDLARRALAALSLSFAAVDVFADDIARPGPVAILEVNATPGVKALDPGALDRLFEAVADRIGRGS